jgi:hypothetical protein
LNRKEFRDNEQLATKTEEAALLILKDTILEINNFCYDDSDHSIEIGSIDMDKKQLNPNGFRQKTLREQGFMKLLSVIS